MIKPLDDKHKKQDAPVQETGAASGRADFSQAQVGAYSPVRKLGPDLSRKAWDEEEALNASMAGRLAIRVFSRGILGAAFFAAGGLLADKWMMGGGRYNPNAGFREQKNPLQVVAKIIDTVAGKPIEWTVTNAAKLAGKESAVAATIGKNAVHFRPTKFRGLSGVAGRSLGHEAVAITFDFFCASIGDAWGRDLSGIVDPHVKKDWIKDGHLDLPQSLKSMLKSVFRYLTLNGGEDWAVAIPYAYFMKAQRGIINHFSPGFRYDFDRAGNGGSNKMGGNPYLADGKTINPQHKPEVVGSYALEGMIDLQGRFTAYNIGTLMYRELYDHVENKLQGKKTSLYGSPDSEDKKGFIRKSADVVKWMARSVVKGTLYMTPVVPFFSINRTAQFKHDGLFIHPEHGVLTNDIPATGAHSSVRAHNIHDMTDFDFIDDHVYYSDFNPKKYPGNGWAVDTKGITQPRHPPKFENPFPDGFDSYVPRNGLITKNSNRLGKLNDRAAHILDKPAEKITTWLSGHKIETVLKNYGVDSIGNFTRPFIRASIAYTPYMYAKAEAANLWDNGEMDMSIERMVDGASRFNWGEFKAGIGEVTHAFLRRPQSDPTRAAEAKRRRLLDDTPPEDFDKAQHEHDRQVALKTWGQRILNTRPPQEEKKRQGANNDDVTGRIGFGKPVRTVGEQSKTYAEQEALRQALEQSTPPTNAIH